MSGLRLCDPDCPKPESGWTFSFISSASIDLATGETIREQGHVCAHCGNCLESKVWRVAPDAGSHPVPDRG